MHHYFCYGLRIASELALPELTAIPAGTGEPDVRIRLAVLSPEGPADTEPVRPGLWLGSRTLRLHVRDVAWFEVRDGRDIAVMPLPSGNPLSVRLFLQGSVFGALLMQRDHLVLHGNAIRIGDACMICVGHSGAGKSTLAAAFLERGHDILADDVVPVTADGCAIPGFPRIKLWQDAADRLDIATGGLLPVMPGMSKYNLPLQRDEQALRPLPVRWIYLLDWHDQDSLALMPVDGVARFGLLRANSYRKNYLRRQDMLTRHLAQCAALANRTRIARVLRPADKSLSPADTVARLLADMAVTT